jgi:hypothetical protein
MSNSYDWYYLFALVCAFTGIAVVISIRWFYRKSAELLQSWAQKNGYHIIEQEQRSIARGPFFWSASSSQAVFRVKVQDPSGYPRSGWVRVGNWWSGLLSDEVDVRWDDESR